MTPTARAPAFGLLALCLSGCVLSPGPGDRTPVALGRERASCPGIEPDRRLFGREAIEGVEPHYVVVPSKGGQDRRLAGATLRIRPALGLSGPLLERMVRCHSARQTLRREPAEPDSPYWLPDGWVNFEFGAEQGAFLVHVSAPEASRAERAGEILARARSYASGAPLEKRGSPP